MGNLEDAPMKPVLSKPTRFGCFGSCASRVARNIRLSFNMVRSVYYVGMTGVRHGLPSIRWEIGALISILIVREIFIWVMNQQISEFYHVTSQLVSGAHPEVIHFLFKFVGAAAAFGTVSPLMASFQLMPYLDLWGGDVHKGIVRIEVTPGAHRLVPILIL